jgi:hypothetical protein
VFPDIGPTSRALVCVVWLGGQAALVATGSMRPDGAFAFRMFPESSTISVTLARDVASPRGVTRVPIRDGNWLARDAIGTVHRFRWDERVKDGNIQPYGQPIHASYGAAAQLDRLSHALDDVAEHIDDDTETVRLIADVTVRKNGGRPEHVHLESAPRPR